MAKKADESPGITGSYRHELEASAERLESPRARAEASAVADDLELKVAHCKALGIGMGGKVRVSVTTRRGNQVVNNWQVLYLPRIFQNAPGVAPGLMPKWTSPAEEMLEPGRYLLWARDPVSGKSTAPQVVPFSGRADIPVDLAVP